MNPAPTTTTRGRVVQLGAQREAVVEGAEDVDAGERRRLGQGARDGAGGQDACVEGEPLAVGEEDGAVGDVERRGAAAEPPVDGEVVVGQGAQRRPVGVPLPRQHLLGQRRAIVGQVRLGPDHDEPPAEPEGARLLDGAQAGQRGSDDHHRRAVVEGHHLGDDIRAPFRARPGRVARRGTRPIADSRVILGRPAPARAPGESRCHSLDDVSGRPLRLRDVDLDIFLHPRTVAVIGASETSGKPNAAMTRRIKEWADAHGATFFPVHPVYEAVLGVRCYASIADVPGDIDLAVILTGRAVDSFEEVVARKASFAVIFAAGFSEAGADGEALEDRLATWSGTGSTHLLGPNTNLNAFSEFRDDLPGPSIALITQSGHQGRPIFQGQEIGIAVSHWAPTGNEVDLEFADFARYFADQPEVGVIAAYIEGFKDGRSLMLAADHAARPRKPLVVVKVGRTEAGRRWRRPTPATSPGPTRSCPAVFRQFGVTRVDGLDELLDTSAAFARTKPPRGDGVCVYAISGGTGAHMADMASAVGLRLPELTAETQRALHDGLIPSYLRVSNPVDCGGPPVTMPAGRQILDLLVADPNVDILICPITGALDMMSEPLARDLVAVATTTDKPIFVVWGSPVGTERAYNETLLSSRLPVFRTFGNCVRAVARLPRLLGLRPGYRSPFEDAPTEPRPAAARIRRQLAAEAPGASLSEAASKQLLAAYGIRPTQDRLCTTAAEAVEAAERLGYPVVMKASAPSLTHKSDLGLVAVGVSSAAEVRRTFADLRRRAERAAGHGRPVDGVLVCELVDGGVEMVLGVAQDPLFGPVVMCGLGGVFVEVLGDVTFRVPPFSRDEAARMVAELRGCSAARGRAGRQAGGRRRAARRHHERATSGHGPRRAERARRDRRGRHQPARSPAPRRGGPRCLGGAQVTDNVDDELLARIEDQVLWLTLNRPDAGNAITPAVRNRMIEHLDAANDSFDVRAIVLTAAGEKHFCTGADLRTGRAAPPPRPEGAPERVGGRRGPDDPHRHPAPDQRHSSTARSRSSPR